MSGIREIVLAEIKKKKQPNAKKSLMEATILSRLVKGKNKRDGGEISESFASDIQEVQASIAAAKSDNGLVTALKKWAKQRGTPIKLSIERGHPNVDVAGFFDAEQAENDEVPVSLVIQLPSDAKLSEVSGDLSNRFVTAVDHEWRHAYQSSKRDFIPARSPSKKFTSDNAKYLAHDDEIDAYSQEVARELLTAGVQPSGAIDAMAKVSHTLQMYITEFGKNSPVVKNLIRKAVAFYKQEQNMNLNESIMYVVRGIGHDDDYDDDDYGSNNVNNDDYNSNNSDNDDDYGSNNSDNNDDDPQPNVYASYAISVLDFITTSHVHHWITSSAQMHQISGNLYEQMQEAIDEFVESAIGAGEVSIQDIIDCANSAKDVDYTAFDPQLYEISESTSQMLDYVKQSGSRCFVLMDKLGDIQEILTKYRFLSKQV